VTLVTLKIFVTFEHLKITGVTLHLHFSYLKTNYKFK